MKYVMLAVLLPASLLVASRSDYLSIKQKFSAIEKERLRPGSRVALPARELNAYVQEELPKVAPDGIRNPTLELPGDNVAIGHLAVNFVKIQNARGNPPNWITQQLLNGEHNLTVTARLNSSNGYATVDLKRVDIDGVPIQGAPLDFLIRNYLIPNYPDAKIGTPFKLDYGMERLEVAPGIAYVVLRPKNR